MKALVSAWVLDGQGGGERLQNLDACRTIAPERPLWMHVVRSEEDAPQFLDCVPGTPSNVRKALFAEDTRPRCEVIGDGLLLNLRTPNINQGADPTDMLSVRIWATGNRVISLRRYKIGAVEQIRKQVEKGDGPKSVSDFVVMLSERLTDQLAPIIENLEDRLEVLEDDDRPSEAEDVAMLRKEVVTYRRFIEPQLVALTKLVSAQLSWLSEADRSNLRHIADYVARQREHLEALRERATILKDIQQSRATEKMNRTMYFLTIVAGLFLPLSFVTGLLGINVGGIPGSEISTAFWWVVVGMVIVGVLELLLFKWRRWL